MSDAAPPSADSRWRLILNGKSAGNDEVRESVMALRERGVELDVRVTWEAGDAERYVAEALDDGIAVLIAGGGDGTLNAIAGALARHDAGAAGRPSLALLPLGTGNDFATAAQVPTDADEALRLVQRSPARTVDLLRIEADGHEHWCANLATGGFGTQVTVETDEGLKKVLGGLAYLITGIARLGRIEPVRARFSGPGFEWQGGFIALGIGNARQAGGGQVLCPDAVIDDDLLDVTIVPELDQPIGVTVASVLTEGKQRALDRIAVRRRLPWVEIEAPQPFTLNLDGEPVRATRFHVDCVAHCLRMHLPPGCPLLRMSGNPLPASGEPPVSRPENAL